LILKLYLIGMLLANQMNNLQVANSFMLELTKQLMISILTVNIK